MGEDQKIDSPSVPSVWAPTALLDVAPPVITDGYLQVVPGTFKPAVPSEGITGLPSIAPKDAAEESAKSFFEDAEKQYQALVGRIVKPHTKKSRPVTEGDVNNIQDDIQALYLLCTTPVGIYRGAFAMAHSQINDTDPLQLFVMNNMLIVCNPVITRHSGYTKDHDEACVTFADRKMTTVQRWQKIEVTYQTVMVDPLDEKKFMLSGPITENLSGMAAFIIQHEMDHADAVYIYKDIN